MEEESSLISYPKRELNSDILGEGVGFTPFVGRENSAVFTFPKSDSTPLCSLCVPIQLKLPEHYKPQALNKSCTLHLQFQLSKLQASVERLESEVTRQLAADSRPTQDETEMSRLYRSLEADNRDKRNEIRELQRRLADIESNSRTSPIPHAAAVATASRSGATPDQVSEWGRGV